MGALGDIVNGAIDSVSGSSSGTHLKDFLNHFSPSDGKWIQTIDPLTTFELTFKFHPDQFDAGEKKGNSSWVTKLQAIGNSAFNSMAQAGTNALNNATGGLLGAIVSEKTNVKKMHKGFKQAGQESFMEYLAPANMLATDAGAPSFGKLIGAPPDSVRPLELNLGVYCQDITVPQMTIADGGVAAGMFGDFPINGTVLKPDNNKLTMSILNTRVPLIERLFYPWMREVTLPYWSYDTQPYTTATITVDFTKHADMKYVFCGCRPTFVNLTQPNQQNSEIKRQVTFAFDFMYISSKLRHNEKALKKLLGSAQTLMNSGAKMMNF